MTTPLDNVKALMERARRQPGRPHALELQGRRPCPGVTVSVASAGHVTLTAPRGGDAPSDEAEVREWMRTGELRFSNTAEATRWLRRYVLAPEPAPAPPVATPPAVDVGEVERLTLSTQNATRARVDPVAVLACLRKQVFGQDHVLAPLSHHVARHIARRHPRRPATWMLVGPTGVGKTATALGVGRALGELLPRGAGYPVTRIDCAELGEPHRRSQLFGAPQGYVGHGDGSQLLDDLTDNPRRIVLFDEVEKAHPTVFQSVMAAMDAGRMTSPARTASGVRDVDCCSAIFIFTSNAEADTITQELERRVGFDDRGLVDEVCRQRLREFGLAPELVGRISAFFPFRRLTDRAEAEVVALAVLNVATEYGVQVAHVDAGVIAAVLNRTRARAYGARPIEYIVDELLGSAFAEVDDPRVTPVRVLVGPPMRCVSAADPADGSVTTP